MKMLLSCNNTLYTLIKSLDEFHKIGIRKTIKKGLVSIIDLDRYIVFNATFSNISAISWRPVLVVEEARENHRPWASNW